MTEQEWLSATSPDGLLKWLMKSKRHRPTRRKLALFAVACARRMGKRVEEEFTREGLDLAERLADTTGGEDEIQEFMGATIARGQRNENTHIAVWAVRVLELNNVVGMAPESCARTVAGWVSSALQEDEPAQQADLLREVLGNPYRQIALDQCWVAGNGSAVAKLAEAIYEQRAFERMPILADALEDASCHIPLVLEHCRGSGPHVRGCWVLDLLLAKK